MCNCIDDGLITKWYGSFDNRLASYNNWEGLQNHEEMALAGFFYTNRKNICMCYHCYLETEFKDEDIPLGIHLTFSPHCEYALLMERISAREIIQEKPRKYKISIRFILFLILTILCLFYYVYL